MLHDVDGGCLHIDLVGCGSASSIGHPHRSAPNDYSAGPLQNLFPALAVQWP